MQKSRYFQRVHILFLATVATSYSIHLCHSHSRNICIETYCQSICVPVLSTMPQRGPVWQWIAQKLYILYVVTAISFFLFMKKWFIYISHLFVQKVIVQNRLPANLQFLSETSGHPSFNHRSPLQQRSQTSAFTLPSNQINVWSIMEAQGLVGINLQGGVCPPASCLYLGLRHVCL